MTDLTLVEVFPVLAGSLARLNVPGFKRLLRWRFVLPRERCSKVIFLKLFCLMT